MRTTPTSLQHHLGLHVCFIKVPSTHCNMLLLASNNMVHTLLAKKVHDLALLLRLHAREDNHVAHDSFQEGRIP